MVRNGREAARRFNILRAVQLVQSAQLRRFRHVLERPRPSFLPESLRLIVLTSPCGGCAFTNAWNVSGSSPIACNSATSADRRGFDLISDALPFGRLWYGEPNAISDAIGYGKFFSRSHDGVIRVYDEAGNVIETHEEAGEFKEW
jgi:hypothetical protein